MTNSYEEMTREKVLSLDIEDLIVLVNEMTRNGVKVTEVAKTISIGDKTLRNRIKEGGYIFNRELKEYVKSDDKNNTISDDGNGEEKTLGEVKSKRGSRTKVTDNFSDGVLMEIAESVRGIKELLEAYREQERVEGINISLKDEEELRTTIRVNKRVWEKFERFSKENKEYKKKDLLSMALKEYINTHK